MLVGFTWLWSAVVSLGWVVGFVLGVFVRRVQFSHNKVDFTRNFAGGFNYYEYSEVQRKAVSFSVFAPIKSDCKNRKTRLHWFSENRGWLFAVLMIFAKIAGLY